MKILGYEIRRAPSPRAREADGGADFGVVGRDDTGPYTWLWSNDPNPLFRTRARFDVFDEMRKSDPSVRAALMMCKLPARAAKWRVDPYSDDPIDKLVAEACAWQLGVGEEEDGPLVASWSAVQAQASLKLDFGCMFEEIIWGDEPFTWRDADGDEHLLLGVQRLAPRTPRTVDRIQNDPRTGHVSEFKQWLPGAKPIPPEKLIAHATDREDGQWGTSLLRSMYGSWKFKRELMISSGIGWDRFASGIPKVTHPHGDAAERKAQRIGRGLRAHERGYVTQEFGGEWDVDILNGSGTLADPVPLLRFHCEQIADGALQFFTNLASSQTGSRAVGDVLIDPFFQAVQADAEETASMYRSTLLRKFVTVNFGERVPTPYLRPGRIGSRDIAVLCQAMFDASSAGMEFTDPETQDAVREIMGLPALPDDYEPPEPGEGDPVPPTPPPILPPAAPEITPPAAP